MQTQVDYENIWEEYLTPQQKCTLHIVPQLQNSKKLNLKLLNLIFKERKK
jgi:hypothetical protein